jgi:DNA-binding NtrC family response regulator
MMPRMDGIELLSRIRAGSPWVKVVIVTANPDPEVRSKAMKLGAFAVISKPCDMEHLKGTVKSALVK